MMKTISMLVVMKAAITIKSFILIFFYTKDENKIDFVVLRNTSLELRLTLVPSI